MAARKTTMDRLQELVRLHRLGTGTRQSARLLKMSPNTERKYREALQVAGLYDGAVVGAVAALPTLSELKEAVAANGRVVPSQQRSEIEAWRAAIEELPRPSPAASTRDIRTWRANLALVGPTKPELRRIESWRPRTRRW